tara:strand:- start:188 stop:583 length:396 start_codon:yes stop_codon:yes gene_type:complete
VIKDKTEYQDLVNSDESFNIGIDFDGVIHKNSLGFHDGTIYDEEIEGTRKALELLSQKFNIIVYTCKARKDRVLVNGKTGTELVWEWLKDKNLDQYINDVTAEKPRAKFYIDDKAVYFQSWDEALNKIKDR